MNLRERLGLEPARTDNVPSPKEPRAIDQAPPTTPEWVRRALARQLPATDRTGPLGR